MMDNTKDLKLKFPLFYMGDQVLNAANRVKYLGQIIGSYLNDDMHHHCMHKQTCLPTVSICAQIMLK